MGHWKRDCPKRSQRNDSKSSSRQVNVSSSGYNNREAGKRGGALIAISERRQSKNGTRNEAFVTLSEAMTACRGNSGRSNCLYLDSGASDHMTYYKESLI